MSEGILTLGVLEPNLETQWKLLFLIWGKGTAGQSPGGQLAVSGVEHSPPRAVRRKLPGPLGCHRHVCLSVFQPQSAPNTRPGGLFPSLLKVYLERLNPVTKGSSSHGQTRSALLCSLLPSRFTLGPNLCPTTPPAVPPFALEGLLTCTLVYSWLIHKTSRAHAN